MMDFAFIGPADMMIVMGVALVIFGPKRLPEVGRQLGGFMREMRKMMGQVTDAMEDMHQEFKPQDSPYKPAELKSARAEDIMQPYDQREVMGPPKPVEVVDRLSITSQMPENVVAPYDAHEATGNAPFDAPHEMK